MSVATSAKTAATRSSVGLSMPSDVRAKIEALKEMLEYVKNYKEAESSYTIQWNLKGENSLNTSYFRAKNILGALDKLYFERDPNSIIVFSVMLNPIS